MALLAPLSFAGAADPLPKDGLTAPPDIFFSVLREGEKIGHHSVVFQQKGRDLHVTVDIQLEVRWGFLTLFAYQHSNREVWRDGRLISIETRTDDHGTLYEVTGRATPAGFEVEGASGRFLAADDIIPASYWHPETVKQSTVLDTQHGRLLEVSVKFAGRQALPIAQEKLEVLRYRTSGDLQVDLWYDSAGRWAKMGFSARGSDVVYAKEPLPDSSVRAASAD